MKYRWRSGSKRHSGDPQVVGEVLETIREQNGGLLAARQVVRAATPVTHPLHRYFAWDDREAGRKFRNIQAQQLIASVFVEVEGGEEPLTTHAYVSIGDSRPQGRFFVGVADAMADPEMRAQVLSEAMGAIAAWRKRYRDLHELSEIFEAIDHVGAGV